MRIPDLRSSESSMATDRGGLRGQLGQHGVAHDGEDMVDGETLLTKDPVSGGPVLELAPGGGQQPSHGVTAQAQEAAQGEGLRAVSDAVLSERGGAFLPELLEGGEDAGRVFFRTEGGGLRRRRASKLLSSTDHSTVSPREKSMA